MRIRALILVCSLLLALPAGACTIFVLTDGERTLFCNNEDWKETETRLWFIPAEDDRLGCAYLGFDNGWAQGGVNTAGLAFDWVSGFEEKWERPPALKAVRGNPSQRMLESCRTVADAVEFYRAHWEPDFARSRILVADRSGASAVIGARLGALHVVEMTNCRGFGYGGHAVTNRLARPPEITVQNAFDILREARQEGEFATKYANVFDLTNGDLYLRPTGSTSFVRLNLQRELSKGPHYYELPKFQKDVAPSPLPLPARLQRFPLDVITSQPGEEPEVTELLTRLIRDAAAGSVRSADYSPELWREISGNLDQTREDLKALGELRRLIFVERRGEGEEKLYRYKAQFAHALVLQSFTLGRDRIVLASESEMVEWKVE